LVESRVNANHSDESADVEPRWDRLGLDAR